MLWGGLEYLTVPQWRMAFEAADVIFGIDRDRAKVPRLRPRRAGDERSHGRDGPSTRASSVDRLHQRDREMLTAACESTRTPRL
jgi:hypothetical protein